MRLSVSEMAKLTGVSIRTLHHYDHIGLLCPATAADSGYRWYRAADVEKMQQILFYRELDFPLKEIRDILADPQYDKQEALRRQRQLLLLKRERLDGLLGFLVYNFNPAKVFMGDTGSLFLGGAVAALAFAYDMPPVLITLGIIYIIETLSDIIQVGYFKLSHGKRVFKMAPFHHHLEMGGWTGKKWSEKELFVLFTGISLLFAIISFIGVFQRYAL